MRNSWGSYWGENGFFRIVRGVNNLAIEQECSWAIPKNNFTNRHYTTTAEQNDPANDKTVYPFPQPEYSGNERPYNKACRVSEAKFTKEVKTTHSFDPVDVLPKNVDWRQLDGRNWLSWTKN